MQEVDIYSKNGVLLNNLGITDEDSLEQAEVDITSATIYKTLNDELFELSSKEIRRINKSIFKDIYPFAGKYRKINIVKSEPVLQGLSVKYVDSNKISINLNKVIDKQKELDINILSNDELLDNISKLTTDIWQIHPFREGNTRTVIVFICKYLDYLNIKYDINILINNIKYIRTSLVRASFDDTELGFLKDDSYLKKIINDSIKKKRIKPLFYCI